MAIKKNLALFALFVFSTPAFAQGFGSPNGVGFPSTSSGSGASPLTTKGDVFTFSTVNTRLPVGTNGQLLSADNTQATGLKWITASGTGTVTSFSANNLSPLFTTSVATGTTTPVLSFALSNAGAHTYFGNNTGSSAAPSFLTNTQLTADLNVFTSLLQGLAPASGGGTTNFLRADGTWAAPAGGGGLTSPVGIADGGTGQTSKTAAFDALSPNTTGGDITYHNGTNNVALTKGKYDRQLAPDLNGNPAWIERPVAPSVTTAALRMAGWIKPASPGSTSLSTVGFSTGTNRGTATAASDATGTFINYASAATNGSGGGQEYNTFDDIRRETSPRVWIKIKTGASGDLLVQRTWVALTSSLVVLAGTDASTSAHYAGCRFSTNASDTNWMFCTNDGSGSQTVTDTGVAVAANTVYTFCFVFGASSVDCYINGNLVASNTTDLPGSSISLQPMAEIITLENVAKNLKFSSVYYDML